MYFLIFLPYFLTYFLMHPDIDQISWTHFLMYPDTNQISLPIFDYDIRSSKIFFHV
ncbi:unnamed protein product [Arabidopsis halleri]